MRRSAAFMVINILLFTLATAGFTFFALAQIYGEAARQARLAQESHLKTFWELLKNKGQDFEIVDGKLMADKYVTNGNYELPDKIRDLFGGTATIFMGDTRVTTNVLREDGTRAVGTKLQGPAYDAIFRDGKPYRGEAPILGIPYFTAYDPIRNARGETIGVLYVGIKKSDFFAAYESLKFKVIGSAVVLIVVFSVLSVLVLRERKKFDKVIKEIDEKAIAKMKDSPTPQFLIDRGKRIAYWNKALEGISGVRAQQAVGATDLHKAFEAIKGPQCWALVSHEFMGDKSRLKA